MIITYHVSDALPSATTREDAVSIDDECTLHPYVHPARWVHLIRYESALNGRTSLWVEPMGALHCRSNLRARSADNNIEPASGVENRATRDEANVSIDSAYHHNKYI